MPESAPATRGRLLVVTGSGRSGTSTVAGTLKRLGLYVPQPEMPADERNPRGFYEPAWVINFHKGLLDSIPTRPNDARPLAAEQIREAAAAPEVREELATWLAEQVAIVGPGGQLAIKDPTTFWVHELWSNVAADLDLDLSFLTMLRHPTQVVQSRTTHYHSDKPDDFRRARQTANLAGWVNAAYETEVATRAHPRAFVRYADLLADWRGAMRQAAEQTGVTYDADLTSTEHHDVDDFIDVKLNRAQITWDEVDTIPQLQEQAVAAWGACDVLVDAPYDEAAIATLAEMHESYVALHQYAEAITIDHTSVAVAQERRAVQERLRAAHAEKTADLKRRLDRRKRQVAELEKQLGRDGGAEESTGRSRLPWKR
ncbi:sulfotransferase [Nocardioides sp. CN2-186]|uniref:sulfotransferase family protein n=1 Tax=Nocardioides tweenelious TaxID=3156607 RepID=UPI0032B4764C